MKKKILTFFLLGFLLFFSLPVFASVSYSRMPNASSSSSFTFSVSFDDFVNDVYVYAEEEGVDAWAVLISGNEGDFLSQCLSSSTKSITFTPVLPEQLYTNVYFEVGFGEDCSWSIGTSPDLEANSGQPIFWITQAPAQAGYSMFSMPENFNTNTLAYVAGLITDLSTPINIIAGLALGMLIIKFIIGLFKRKKS